jgi:hypothetical protein
MISASTRSESGYGGDGFVTEGDTITITFLAKCSTVHNIPIRIGIADSITGSTLFNYTNTGGNQWVVTSTDYIQNVSSTKLESYSITMLSAPASGRLGITFKALSTGPTDLFMANLKITATSSLASKQALYNQTASNQYKKSVTIPIGGQFPVTSNSQIQSIVSSTDVALEDYTRFSGGPTYETLSKLLFSQLYNIYAKANINLQLTQYNLFTGTKVLGLLENFRVEDPTSIINITDARFVMSNCTFDYVNNTLSGTALQVSNDILSYTLLSSIPTAPPPVCYLWVNVSSSSNWVGSYTNCAGVFQNTITLTPFQSICASDTPVKISGPDLLQGSQC